MNEVLIIGGGPAGSTLGCYLSKAGIQNVILESNMHPRPHVGESLVMSTVPVLAAMREYIETVERTEGHVSHDHLADIPIDNPPSPD